MLECVMKGTPRWTGHMLNAWLRTWRLLRPFSKDTRKAVSPVRLSGQKENVSQIADLFQKAQCGEKPRGAGFF